MSGLSSLQDQEILPPPPDDADSPQETGCRLWIGNLDNRITEFNLLKLLQKHGTLDKFDFIIHKTGPDAGKPRGYCFATYSSIEEAERAKKGLDGKLALSKHLVVRNANANRQDEFLTRFTVGAAAKQKSADNNPISKDAKIRAIEAKLRLMERNDDKPVIPGTGPSTRGYGHHGNTHRASQGARSDRQYPGPSRSGSHRSRGQGHRGHQPYSRGSYR